MRKTWALELKMEGDVDIEVEEQNGVGIDADGYFTTDWLRQQQEDPPHDAFRPQGLPRQQPPRLGPSPHAQQDLCRRVSTYLRGEFERRSEC